MKIALVGRGNMGQAITQALKGTIHTIDVLCSSVRPPESQQEAILGCDVVLDFSRPEIAIENIHLYTQVGIPSVIGVTGWYDDLDLIRGWVAENQSSLLYSANFSTGIALFKKMLGALSNLDHQSFNLSLNEIHHTRKVDQPSGTAIELSNCFDREVAVTSERVGDIKGVHSFEFSGTGEKLEIRHAVEDRQVFAVGAIKAAEWLLEQDPGLFTFDDVFSDVGYSEQVNH